MMVHIYNTYIRIHSVRPLFTLLFPCIPSIWLWYNIITIRYYIPNLLRKTGWRETARVYMYIIPIYIHTIYVYITAAFRRINIHLLLTKTTSGGDTSHLARIHQIQPHNNTVCFIYIIRFNLHLFRGVFLSREYKPIFRTTFSRPARRSRFSFESFWIL